MLCSSLAGQYILEIEVGFESGAIELPQVVILDFRFFEDFVCREVSSGENLCERNDAHS